MAENHAQQILKVMQANFAMHNWITENNDPFRTLIVTIISQNTADRNTAKAFENLSSKFKITPEVLANAQTSQIEQSLKVAGLYRNKTKAIRDVSRIILEKHHGVLTSILSLSLEEARANLMQLPGIGPKTADVVLLFCAQKHTIPVDTHVYRVSKRLGLAPVEGDYEAVRVSLQKLYYPRDYLAVHVMLIQHGRKYCKARNPLCKRCPINELCPSRNMRDKRD